MKIQFLLPINDPCSTWVQVLRNQIEYMYTINILSQVSDKGSCDSLIFIIFSYVFSGKFSLGSGRKKDKSKQKVIPDLFSLGTIGWSVQVRIFTTDIKG